MLQFGHFPMNNASKKKKKLPNEQYVEENMLIFSWAQAVDSRHLLQNTYKWSQS